jgi:S1-C subfamily serine protease
VTTGGMSGGPVFDADGRVVGIHGQGDTVGTIMSQ